VSLDRTDGIVADELPVIDTSRNRSDVAAGLALLVIPLLTVGVKVIAPGWMLLIYIFGLVAFIPLYVLVAVIAATGFLRKRPAFAFADAGRMRAKIAAWTHPTAFLLATAVLPDGGDSGDWGTPFSVLFGIPNSADVVTVTSNLFWPLVVVSGIALVILVVEWIRALVLRRRFTVR
jgi:hypothetical protein